LLGQKEKGRSTLLYIIQVYNNRTVSNVSIACQCFHQFIEYQLAV
jgi:hypothetical protein